MKIDMSGKAVMNRLKTVNQPRKACLSLANSSAGNKSENNVKHTATRRTQQYSSKNESVKSAIINNKAKRLSENFRLCRKV